MKVIQEVPLKVSPLVQDLLNQSEQVRTFVSDFFSKENCISAAGKRSFSKGNRDVLVAQLSAQYAIEITSDEVKKNILSLQSESTFTVVTGHQICSAGGPLYLIYKIFSAIRITQELNAWQDEFHFVPVYWMATEDHDIEEIRHFHWGNEKVELATEFEGVAGELPTEDFLSWLNEKRAEGKFNDIGLSELFIQAYSKKNFAEATRYWVNELLGEYGVVCIDGNDSALKELACGLFEKEIQEKIVFSEVSKTNLEIENSGYNPNIQPRNFNLFWLKNEKAHITRKRLDLKDEVFQTSDAEEQFTAKDLMEMRSELSPNVLLRPLYQETILPNIVYIGGPSELGYWLQLKNAFDAANLQMPLLAHRLSMVLVRKRDLEFVSKNNLNIAELVQQKLHEAQKKMLGAMNAKSFENEISTTSENFEKLRGYISEIDASLLGWLSAEEKRQLDQWSNIEQKIKKAIKSKEEVKFNQLEKFFAFTHPNHIQQERVFSLLYATEIVGWKELKEVLEQLDPFKHSSTIAG
ncbi:MAG: bacillithiol biosynthesis cysteine-adding enzyme BshC [Flavobacteriales bacterium]|nr:bacillithiol biosynthesis cysteine-adding enzyme BshC [Flavobacteriales bacterium]